MKGYSEWTSRSHLIAELLSRQHKWQPERQGDRKRDRGMKQHGTKEQNQKHPQMKQTSERAHTYTHNNDITISTKLHSWQPSPPHPLSPLLPLLPAISLSIFTPFLCLHYFNHSIKSVNTFIIVASGGGCYLAITLFSNCIVTGDDGKRRAFSFDAGCLSGRAITPFAAVTLHSARRACLMPFI